MTKMLIIGDVHLSDVTPKTRTDNYTEAIFTKLDFLLHYAASNNIPYIVTLGDLFHRKRPNLSSHRIVAKLMRMFLEWKEATDGQIFGIIGNHDIYHTYDNIDKQPIKVLEAAGAIHILDGTPVQIGSIELNGVHYTDDFDEDEKGSNYRLRSDDPSKTKVWLFHSTLLPDGEQFFGHWTNFCDIADIEADVVVCGHFHPGFDPPVQVDHGKFWINPGALSRGTAEEHNLTRSIQAVWLSVKEGTILHSVVDVPHEPAPEIFKVVDVKAARESRSEVEGFVDSIKSSVEDINVDSVASLKAALSELSDDPVVVARAQKYIDDAAEDLGI